MQAHEKCACQDDTERWKAQRLLSTPHKGSSCLSLSYLGMDLFVCGFGGCWLQWGSGIAILMALVISGCQPSLPRHQTMLLGSVKGVTGK